MDTSFNIMTEISHYLKFKNLSKNLEKYVFQSKKLNFEPTVNSVYTTEFLALVKTLHIYIKNLVFYKHVKWKPFKYKFTFNSDFIMNS